jgi:Ala-tRNA(Pro) deacylase
MATMTAERVRTHLDERGISYEVMDHPTAYTAQEIAAAEHISGRSFAKPVMLMADGRIVMAVMPGDARVDFDKAPGVLGAKNVRLATEAEFSSLFPDCEAGAEPPFGNLYGVPVYLDEGFESERIVCNAGSHRQTISLRLSDFLALVQPTRTDLSTGR